MRGRSYKIIGKVVGESSLDHFSFDDICCQMSPGLSNIPARWKTSDKQCYLSLDHDDMTANPDNFLEPLSNVVA